MTPTAGIEPPQCLTALRHLPGGADGWQGYKGKLLFDRTGRHPGNEVAGEKKEQPDHRQRHQQRARRIQIPTALPRLLWNDFRPTGSVNMAVSCKHKGGHDVFVPRRHE